MAGYSDDSWSWVPSDLAAQWQGYPDATAPVALVPTPEPSASVPASPLRPPMIPLPAQETAAPSLPPPPPWAPPDTGVIDPWGEGVSQPDWEPPDLGEIGPDDGVEAISGSVPSIRPAETIPGLAPPAENDFSVEAEAQRIAALPEEQQIWEEAKSRAAADRLRRTRELEAATAAAEDAENNAKAYRDSQITAEREMRSLDDESKALANEHVDQDRWMASRSGMQTVAAYLAAALGGFSAGMTGGRNQALDVILGAIDRDIQLQTEAIAGKRSDISDRRNAVAQRLAMTGDLYRSQESVRLATLGVTAQKIEAEIAGLDPRGTSARNLAGVLRGIEDAKAAALAAYQDKVRAQSLEDIKIGLEQEKVRRSRDYSRMGGGGGGGAKPIDYTKVVRTPEWIAAYMGIPEVSADLRARGDMTLEQYDDWIQRRDKVATLTKKEQELPGGVTQGYSKEELERSITDVTGEQFLQPDGTPVVARGSLEDISKTNKVINSATRIIDLLDEIERLGVGFSPDILKSKRWQEIQSNWTTAKLVSKDILGLGQLSEGDIKLVDGFLGGDPTAFINAAPGIKKARDNITAMRRDELGRLGTKDPKRYDPKPPPGAPRETAQDREFGKLFEGGRERSAPKPRFPGDQPFELVPEREPTASELEVLWGLRDDLAKEPALAGPARYKLEKLAGKHGDGGASKREIRRLAELVLTTVPESP